MKRLLLAVAVLAIAAAVGLPLANAGSDRPGGSTGAKAKVVRQLAGSWRLVLFATRSADGTLSYPYGKDAVGKLTYTRDGNQWATIGRRGASKNLPNAFWYTGTFDINLKRRTVVHHVQYSSITAFEGTDLVRSFRLGRNRLSLTIAPSAPGAATSVAKWKRLRSVGPGVPHGIG